MQQDDYFKDISEHQCAMVKGSAVEEITVKSTGKNFTKNDFVLDSTSLCRCVAWEQYVEDDHGNELINVTEVLMAVSPFH